jgi:DNA-binding NtrC family response regulator
VSVNKPADLKGLSILLLDSSLSTIAELVNGLKKLGAEVFSFHNIDKAEALLSTHAVDIILLDLKLADVETLKLIKGYKEKNPHVLFYLTLDPGFNHVDSELDINSLGIDDFLQKPIQYERFAGLMELAFGRIPIQSTSLTITEPLLTKARPFFLFRSAAMRMALANLSEIALSNQTVLITGETGSGKEIIARAIHALSKRANGHFVAVNCGAIPEGLIEGELFGHERGAFTGAFKTRKGKFEMANDGTLLLDEIGDMPLSLQMRLLRVLEDGYVYRVGGEEPIPLNMRIISATRVDLRKAVMDKLFREDLYYRLNILNIHLPPLRERIEDISYLSLFFLERAFAELGRPLPYPSLSPETISILERQSWRGNVRELRNLMTRVATVLPKNIRQVLPIHILQHIDDFNSYEISKDDKSCFSVASPVSLNKLEEDYINMVLALTKGNRTNAAKILGISSRTLRRKLNF